MTKNFLLSLCAMVSLSTPSFSSSLEELYTEAVNLRKASSYIKAYNKFQEIEAMNSQTDFSTKALYNLGWISHKLKWYDKGAVYFFKSNERNLTLFQEAFQPALNALNILHTHNLISSSTVFQDYDTAHVDDQWTKGFLVEGIGGIIHNPNSIQLPNIQCGQGLSINSSSFNGIPLNPIGLQLKPQSSYNDFRNSILNAGLTIVKEF